MTTSDRTDPAATTPTADVGDHDRIDLWWWLPELVTAAFLLLIGAVLWRPPLWLGLALLAWVALRERWRWACNRLIERDAPALECAGDGDDCKTPDSGTSAVCDITGGEATE